MAVHILRDRVFEDSFRELHRRPAEEMKNRLYIVFDREEGQDAGNVYFHGFSQKLSICVYVLPTYLLCTFFYT